MYCSNCGTQVTDNVSYCPTCGNHTGAKTAQVKKPDKKIYQRWWFWVIIVVILLIAIGGSGGDDNSSDNNTNNTTVAGTSTSTPQHNEKKEEAAVIPEIDGFSDIEYENKSPVEFTSAELYTDSDGEEFLILYYTWTNNTDETTSPYLRIIAKAFQNGKELETCFYNVKDFDTDNSTLEVRPGVMLNLHDLWYITDDTPVEIEIQEFWSDDIIASAVIDPTLLR